MRGFLMVALAALVLTASVSAAVHVSLVERSSGLSTVDIAVLSDPIIVDVMIDAGDPPLTMKAAGITIDGVGNYAASNLIYGAFVDTYMDNPAVPAANNAAGWSTLISDVETLLGGPLPLSGGLNNEVSSLALGGAGSGMLGWVELSGYGVGTYAAGGYVGDMNDQGVPVTFTDLVITPEPASVLLLLLGVPFLRRRR